MSFEEYLLLAANGDTKLAFDPKFREQQAPNWLRYLKEKEYENNT